MGMVCGGSLLFFSFPFYSLLVIPTPSYLFDIFGTLASNFETMLITAAHVSDQDDIAYSGCVISTG
jgi:hypothetical protein